MKPRVEIFSQGEEVVSGQIVDSNAAWLASRLNDMGFRVIRHSAVGDDLAHLQALLLEIAERADCCVCTGGLGPTVDDLTAEAVSYAFQRPLLLDEEALSQIQAYFKQRQREMAASNIKQALLPEGSIRLDNHWGTAPGFAIQFKQCWFYFMPGVPSEMKQMFNHSITPRLRHDFTLNPDTLIILRLLGLGESDIQQKLSDWTLPDKVRLGFRTTADDIEVKLFFPAAFNESERGKVVNALAAYLGDSVYCIETGGRHTSLHAMIAESLQQKNLQLTLIESISSGAISARFAGHSCLRLAQIYPNLDGVWADKSMKYVAHELAEPVLALADNIVCLVQLYTDEKQQLFSYLKGSSGEICHERFLTGTIEQKQQRATIVALDLIRTYLKK
ncbi:competence/damage-inducible protein A [methane-oxidizing endosymbiont of Gigantopelta aegis]|uniref:competence/damage-inducible protein A n=1 Tax=methane-oxidizing endosymbiont of Gigantopelta aegis TaxID=2794938 RepID=UPI0018DB36CB|nr:CinA family nicotinamide mononucleotide deamidase-related protein [methane-oxidizing endosymbiont of Gigantopelta aegis]